MGTTARVTVTVDVQVPSHWSDETTVAQVRKQAVDDAVGMLERIERKYDLKIVGKPTVSATTTEKI